MEGNEHREVLTKLAREIRDEWRIGANTATRVGTALVAIVEHFDRFLSKAHPDATEHLLKLLGGAHFGEYIPGMRGGMIDKDGRAELLSLILRGELIVPELRYNRVTVFKGYNVISPGGGCTVRKVTDNGNGTYTCTPDLEEGEPLAQFADDILMAYWHDKDEQTGAFKGFREMKFRVTAVDHDERTFVLVPRPGTNSIPTENMVLAQIGNFTNKERQTYIAIDTRDGNNCITLYDDANTWEVSPAQEKAWLGKKKGRTVAGVDASTYNAVLKNVIMSGRLYQVDDITGEEIRVPIDKKKYVPGQKYGYYDRVTHNGSLWLCVNEKGTSTEPKTGNADWLKEVDAGKDGASVSNAGEWEEGKFIPYLGLVRIGNATYQCTNPNGATCTYLILTDDSDNYLTDENDAYLLSDEIDMSDFELIAQDGTDGNSGIGISSTDVVYALSVSSTVAPVEGWHTTAPPWEDGKFYWSKTIVVYSDGTKTETNPACITGGTGSNGIDGIGVASIIEQYYLSTSPTTLDGGSWQNSSPVWENGKYIWTRSVITYTNEKQTITSPICVTGDKGDSVTHHGDWKEGKSIPYMGIVRIGDASWMCTNKKGAICAYLILTDDSDNYLTDENDAYLLSDEIDMSNFVLVAEDGADGDDGRGIVSITDEYYLSSSSGTLAGGVWTTSRPGFTNGLFIWKRTTTTYTDGTKTVTEPLCVTGGTGKDGIQGCIIRHAKWEAGIEWRNDEDLTEGTRYLDVAMIQDSSMSTGWRAYKCRKTHISTDANKPGNTTYWEEFGVNVTSLFTSLILAKDAEIEFIQGNQLLVKDARGNVVGGISGEGYSWMGGPSPFNAANVDRADGSGHRAWGNIAWDALGNPTVKGDFIGKISTRSNGVRMVLDSGSNSFTMYDNKENPIVKIGFITEDPGSFGFFPHVRLREYNGNTIIRECSMAASSFVQHIREGYGGPGVGNLDLHISPRGIEFSENGITTKTYARK